MILQEWRMTIPSYEKQSDGGLTLKWHEGKDKGKLGMCVQYSSLKRQSQAKACVHTDMKTAVALRIIPLEWHL